MIFKAQSDDNELITFSILCSNYLRLLLIIYIHICFTVQQTNWGTYVYKMGVLDWNEIMMIIMAH